jgi:hypothetical protein
MFWKPRFLRLSIVTAMLLTIATAGLLFAQENPSPRRGSPPPDWQSLVEAKKRAALQAGVPDQHAPAGPFAQPGVPVRLFTGNVRMTKMELLQRLEAAELADQLYLARLEREFDPAAAQQKRADYEAQRRHIMALPDGPIEFAVPSVEVGHHSISFSKFTYDSCCPKDPINVIFYRSGSPWSVHYDLINWTRTRWKDTSCGTKQWVYIWDSQHTGGKDDWREMEYQMEPVGTGQVCGWERDHLRLFGSFVTDSHNPSFGNWSVTSAHRDNAGHTCTIDWEGPEARLRDAFRDSNGNPLWFVAQIWESDIGNAGRNQCADNNGRAQFIELIY